MAGVHASPAAIDELRQRILKTCEELENARSRLLHQLTMELHPEWKDANYDGFAESLLVALDFHWRPGLDALRQSTAPLGRLVQQLNAYLGESGAERLGRYAHAAEASPSAATAQPPAGAAVEGDSSWRATRDRRPLRAVTSADLQGQTVDWTHLDFEAGSPRYSAASYRALVRALPGVNRVLQAGGSEADFASGSPEHACYDAFYGGEPIRMERARDGVIHVDGGRHRLWACLEAGIEAPVDWTDVGS